MEIEAAAYAGKCSIELKKIIEECCKVQ
jgi:hypothetical protein